MLKKLANSPIALVFALAYLFAMSAVATTLIMGNSVYVAPVIAGAFLVLGRVAAFVRPSIAPSAAATALIGQAIAFTAAFEGHAWQADSHMLFFALLACLVVLRDIPALLVATVITALHHLSLTFVMPSLVYVGAGGLVENLGRTVFHAVIVLIETGALVLTVARLNNLSSDMARQNTELENSLAAAQASKSEAEAARQSALEQQQQAEAASAKAQSLLGEAKEAARERDLANEERNRMYREQEALRAAAADEQRRVVDTLKHALNGLKEGDLTARITADMPEGYAELRDMFNASVDSLEHLVAEVLSQSEAIEGEVQEVAAAANDLALRTQTQANTLRTATDDLDGLTQKVQHAAGSVDDAKTSAQNAQHNATESERVVAEASEVMQRMEAASSEVAKIVQLIEDISFQTNLLALNAGVEAARAGEAGRGFAVVASEVRALAQRSSDSASSIRDLIERSSQEVEQGTAKISETVTSLKKVMEAVFEITSKTTQFADGAKEQKTGVEALQGKITDLDNNTQRNAAMFEETSAACTNLLAGAQALRALTQRFQISGAAPDLRKAG